MAAKEEKDSLERLASDTVLTYRIVGGTLASARAATAKGAVIGTGVGLGVSTVKNIGSYVKGEKELKKTITDLAKDTAKAGIYGGAVGAGSSIVRHGLVKAGAHALARGSLPVSIATATVSAGREIACDVCQYKDREIHGAELAGRVSQTAGSAVIMGATAWAGAEIGALLGVVAGPLGVLVGGLLVGFGGYIIGEEISAKVRE